MPASTWLEEGAQLLAVHRAKWLRRVDFGPSWTVIWLIGPFDALHHSMTWPETLILVLYFFVLSILAIYGWHRYYLVYLYMKHRDRRPMPPPPLAEFPRVTIQLPIYNEMYVADRLIDAVCEIDYPRDRLEIQVLDDSTDETQRHRRAGGAPARGARIRHQPRPPGRSHGLQGGRARRGAAARHAASSSRSSTPTSFRRRTSCSGRCRTSSRTPRVGMVQARWGHINQDYSLLTKIQAILLDAHFVLEHGGRNRAGCFFNFNGTAGVWRREAIDDAGGWQHDTLTEDLDLELPRAAARLAVRLPAGPGRARRSAGRDELLQVAAAPLGEGLDPDLHQAAAAHPELGPAAAA